jgi:phosphonate transport system substrate-binding protein
MPLLRLWLVCLLLATSVEAGVLRFAPLPVADEKSLRADYLPMLDYLVSRTGDTYRWNFMPKYPDLLQAMILDQIDLAVLGPLPYVRLTAMTKHFEPLVLFREKDGRAGYDCVLVAFGKDRALKLKDIKNKNIGLTQVESTCGYFAVARMLRRAGRSPGKDGNRYEYAGNHGNAALGVVQGRYDIAGLKRSQAEKYKGLDLHVIAEAGPYPGFALVANTRTLSPARRTAIRQALLQVDEKTQAGWSEAIRFGVVEANDAMYSEIREKIKALGEIPESPGMR